MSTINLSIFTVGDLADRLSVQSWRIARLFELGLIPEPVRIGGRRMISEEIVPQIVEALLARGWMKPQASQAERIDAERRTSGAEAQP